MPLTDSELKGLVSAIQDDHSEAVIALACLVHLAHARLRAHDPKHYVGVDRLHILGMTCVRAYAKKVGIPWPDVRSAIAALQRAGDTAGYLDSLPD